MIADIGAITALAVAISRSNAPQSRGFDQEHPLKYYSTPMAHHPQDVLVLERLTSLFKACFDFVKTNGSTV